LTLICILHEEINQRGVNPSRCQTNTKILEKAESSMADFHADNEGVKQQLRLDSKFSQLL
jgi:hypothetical protein